MEEIKLSSLVGGESLVVYSSQRGDAMWATGRVVKVSASRVTIELSRGISVSGVHMVTFMKATKHVVGSGESHGFGARLYYEFYTVNEETTAKLANMNSVLRRRSLTRKIEYRLQEVPLKRYSEDTLEKILALLTTDAGKVSL